MFDSGLVCGRPGMGLPWSLSSSPGVSCAEGKRLWGKNSHFRRKIYPVGQLGSNLIVARRENWLWISTTAFYKSVFKLRSLSNES